MKANELVLVSLQVWEVQLIIGALRKSNPTHDEEKDVVNIVEKLRKTIGP